MSDSVRDRYANLLRATRTLGIVDETLHQIELSDAPAPAPFASHSPDAISVGSASKMFWGGLRVGWIRASRDLIPRLVNARVQIDLGSSLFDQLVVVELMGNPDILAFRRGQLRERRDALAQALREQLPDWQFRLPEGGMTLWVRMSHGSATRLAADLEPAGVHLAPGPVFSVEGGADDWLRVPYAKPENQLTEAVRRMAEAWPSVWSGHRNRRESSKLLIA
jgi:DNA-binding transcriptional MocR family regulator